MTYYFSEPHTPEGSTQSVGFGGGIHYCLGAPLARVEAAVALNAMLDRYETVAPGSRPGTRQNATNLVFGFTQLPLRVARG